jgi:hypothetical protein
MISGGTFEGRCKFGIGTVKAGRNHHTHVGSKRRVSRQHDGNNGADDRSKLE